MCCGKWQVFPLLFNSAVTSATCDSPSEVRTLNYRSGQRIRKDSKQEITFRIIYPGCRSRSRESIGLVSPQRRKSSSCGKPKSASPLRGTAERVFKRPEKSRLVFSAVISRSAHDKSALQTSHAGYHMMLSRTKTNKKIHISKYIIADSKAKRGGCDL